MTRTSRLDRLRESMWFVPGLMVIVAMALAQGVIVIDLWLDARTLDLLPESFLLGVEGSRGLLVTIGGSVIAVAATMFSITMSVIATASSTYGPRLVRNFMADRSNQRVLGLFVATFVYCLMVMRRVQDESDGEVFVPHLAVYVALLLALASVAAMVFFLHHIADVIQVATLVRRVRSELEQVADTLYGAQATSGREPAVVMPQSCALALADNSGFVTIIDAEALVLAGKDNRGVVELIATPGTHVLAGEPLARVSGDAEALSQAVRKNVVVGATRTPAQDVQFALQQVIEMAVRAVSPSTNDPYTARNAVDEVACGLVPALRNPDPDPGWVDDEGVVRLVWRPPSGEELVDTVFDDLRNYAAADPLVVAAAIRLAGRLLRVAPDAAARRVQRQLDELLAASGRTAMAVIDLERLEEARASLA